MYTVEELEGLDQINLRNLRSDILQAYFRKHLECNIFEFKLQNGDHFELIFDDGDFIHLTGLHYFLTKTGLDGWKRLEANPIIIGNLDFSKGKDTRIAMNRLKHFHVIPRLLNNPEIYIYKSSDFPQFRYKSVYFAVIVHGERCLKLGLGERLKGVCYPETFIVDKTDPQYNYYLDPCYRLGIVEKNIKFKEKKHLKKV